MIVNFPVIPVHWMTMNADGMKESKRHFWWGDSLFNRLLGNALGLLIRLRKGVF